MRFLKSSVCACVFSAPTFLHDKVIDTAALTQGKLSGNASNPCLVFITKTPSLLLLLRCLLMPLLLPTCCYLRIRKKSGQTHYCVSFFSTGLGDANIMHVLQDLRETVGLCQRYFPRPPTSVIRLDLVITTALVSVPTTKRGFWSKKIVPIGGNVSGTTRNQDRTFRCHLCDCWLWSMLAIQGHSSIFQNSYFSEKKKEFSHTSGVLEPLTCSY